MAPAPARMADSTAAFRYPPNLASLSRHLRAENKSPATITTYAKAVVQLADFLERTARSILRALVEAACRAVV
jgi:hypothetical protein